MRDSFNFPYFSASFFTTVHFALSAVTDEIQVVKSQILGLEGSREESGKLEMEIWYGMKPVMRICCPCRRSQDELLGAP